MVDDWEKRWIKRTQKKKNTSYAVLSIHLVVTVSKQRRRFLFSEKLNAHLFDTTLNMATNKDVLWNTTRRDSIESVSADVRTILWCSLSFNRQEHCGRKPMSIIQALDKTPHLQNTTLMKFQKIVQVPIETMRITIAMAPIILQKVAIPTDRYRQVNLCLAVYLTSLS